ncbi:MAG: hypothetical protein JW822_10190 [Spirochaetales bacterium]|nr:hypothetical protein [Spirochaetales bacterium]
MLSGTVYTGRESDSTRTAILIDQRVNLLSNTIWDESAAVPSIDLKQVIDLIAYLGRNTEYAYLFFPYYGG